MTDPRFVTNALGERIGVILDLETYQQMLAPKDDAELLTELSDAELVALAESKLAPEDQQRLSDSQEKCDTGTLSDAEHDLFERLLGQIDQLNVLRARAQHTLALRADG